MPENTIDSVRAIPGVRRATPQFFTHTLTEACCEIGTVNQLVGYDPKSDWLVGSWLKNAHRQELKDDEVIIGAKIPVLVPDKILVLGKWYNIVAVAEETGTSLDHSLFINMDEARRIVSSNKSLEPELKKYGNPKDLISSILVETEPGADTDMISQKIQTLGFIQPIVAADVKKRIINNFKVLGLLMAAIGLLSFITVLYQLFSRFYTLTWHRQAEWGLYLAIGASGRDIATIIIGEALIVSLAGSLIGVIIGGMLYEFSLKVLLAYQSFPFVYPSWSFIAITTVLLIAFFSGLGALAAWIPACYGSRIDPAGIMTRGEFD
jgi:putative ABC transport system permease protein